MDLCLVSYQTKVYLRIIWYIIAWPIITLQLESLVFKHIRAWNLRTGCNRVKTCRMITKQNIINNLIIESTERQLLKFKFKNGSVWLPYLFRNPKHIIGQRLPRCKHFVVKGHPLVIVSPRIVSIENRMPFACTWWHTQCHDYPNPFQNARNTKIKNLWTMNPII